MQQQDENKLKKKFVAEKKFGDHSGKTERSIYHRCLYFE
jgi:hypothetical protein